MKKLKVEEHPANEFCDFTGFYFDTRKLNDGADGIFGGAGEHISTQLSFFFV